ncbi:MAG TPA: metal ABC transporter ATP-binding protein [Candidatus Izemoplasmatales bacterium]|nr:metal ABC transporter ATP-binding protein [Bacillota bacterium]HRY77600.1 metal ABC transporter ATP-binding protein [Candidatus Izemoplasmatales bacterium]
MQIDINNLSFAYGHKLVLNNLSLTVRPGDFLVVEGKNGTGKTTMIKCLLGINAVPNGMIFLDHEDINAFRDWTKIGCVSQSVDDFNYEFPITVNEILTMSKLRKIKQNRKLKLLDQMGILEILNENINALSGGQRQRVFIVKSMLNHPKILILDEPTANIDKKNVEYFYQTVNELNSEGTTVILITHDEFLDAYNWSHILQLNTDLSYSYRTRKQFAEEAGRK